MDEHLVYNTTGCLTPKQRLARLILGLLAELGQRQPQLSIVERRRWLGLVLVSNKRHLVNQATTQLEK